MPPTPHGSQNCATDYVLDIHVAVSAGVVIIQSRANQHLRRVAPLLPERTRSSSGSTPHLIRTRMTMHPTSTHTAMTGSTKKWVWMALAIAAATAVVSAQTAPAINESLASRQVFPANNWWNLDVRSAPIDGSSQQYIDWISGRATNPSAVRRLHPDFGPPPYGIPYVVVSGDEPLVPVNFVAYGSES